MRYIDILMADATDSYRNLSAKHIAALRWIIQHCAGSIVVKVDDDVLVNPFKLMQYIQEVPRARAFYCSVVPNGKPRRDEGNKWFVRENEYATAYYPPHCEGYAYITDTRVAQLIVEAAQDAQTYWIDDVWITGILAKKTQVGHTSFRKPYNAKQINGWQIITSKEDFDNNLFFLAKYDRNDTKLKVTWQNMVEWQRRRVAS
jgi:hypothetical protein